MLSGVRLGYSVREKQIIVDYIIRKKAHDRIKSISLYREMVEDNVLPQRTEKSLQGVFRNHIITNINNYCDAKQCQIFNRNWQKIKVPRKNPNSRRPVVPNWNDDSEDDDVMVLEDVRPRIQTNLSNWVQHRPRTQPANQRNATQYSKPVTSQHNQPGTSQQSRSATSRPAKQQNVSQHNRPSTSQQNRPATSQPAKQQNASQHNQPGTSQQSRPATSQHNRPSTSQQQQQNPSISRSTMQGAQTQGNTNKKIFLSQGIRVVPMRLVHREILREPEYEEDTEWISKDRQMYSAAFVGPNVEKYSTLEDKTLINFLNSKISNIEDLKYDENWREFNTSAIIPGRSWQSLKSRYYELKKARNLDHLQLPVPTLKKLNLPCKTSSQYNPMEKTQQLTWPKPTYHPPRPAPRAPSYHPSEDEALNNLLQEDDTPDLTNHQPRAIQRQPAVRQARPERRVSPVYQGSQPENGHISPRRNSQRNTDATTYQPKAIQRQIAASQPRPERQLSSIISQPEDGLISLPRNNNIVDRVRDWRSQEQSAINSNECSSINIDEISNVLLEESDPESLPSSPTPNPRGFSPDSYVTDSPPHPVAKMQLPKPKKKPPQPKPLRKPPIKQSKSSVMSVMSQATDFRSALHSNIPHIQKAATAYMNAVKNNENGDSSESDFDPDKVDQHCSKHKRINFEVIEDPIVTNLSGSDNDSDDSQKTIPAPPRTSRSESTLMSEDRAAQSTSMHKEIANRNNTPDISLHYSSDSHSVTGPSDNQPKIKILAPESPLPESVASCDDFEASLNKKVIPESIMGDSDIELSENEDIPDTPEQIVTSIREETVVTEHKAKSKTSTSTKQKQTVPQSSMTFNVTNYNQQISSTNVIPRLQQIPSNMVYIPPQYSMMGQASSVNTAQITEQMHTMGQTINIQANNPAVNSSLQIQNLIHIANSVTQPVILVVPGGSAQEMHQKPPILPQLAYLPQAPPIYPPETLSSVQRESMPQVLPPTLPQTNPPLILPPDVQRESLTQPPINPPETLPPVQRESLPQVPQQPPVNLPETLPPVQRESLPQDRQQPPINPLEILSPVQKESLPQIPQQPPTNLHETLPQVEPQVSEQPLAKPPEMLPALQPHVPLQTLHQTASSSSSCHHKNHCPSCNDSDHSHKPRKRKIIKIVKGRKKFRHNTKSSGKWIVTDMETSDQEMPNTSAPSAPSSSPSTSTTSASPQHRQSNVIAQEFERLASKGAYIINKKDK